MTHLTHVQYIFRGTTVAYKGGKHSQMLPVTCTTAHPVKALWFAMECAARNPDKAVIYVAKIEAVEHLRMAGNVIKKKEEEIAFKIAPQEFYALAMGYVHYKDLQWLLSTRGFEVYQLVRMDNLTELCEKTNAISVQELEDLIKDVDRFLKKS